jgi:hypothetical protein
MRDEKLQLRVHGGWAREGRVQLEIMSARPHAANGVHWPVLFYLHEDKVKRQSFKKKGAENYTNALRTSCS